MSTRKFEFHADEAIVSIAKRANRLLGVDVMDTIMDLEIVHENGCNIDLDGLLKANDGDFGHDVGGIRRHVNRSTGKLENCFVPRYAAQYRKSLAA